MTTEALLAVGFETEHKNAIKKVNYTHDSCIDQIIANPWITQRALAAYFGYTEGWISQVFASDAFQSRLAERKNELVDPTIRATIEERFKALVIQSLEVLKRKLESPIVSDELAIKALDVAAKAAGYGAKTVPTINNQFVVQVPSKAGSSAEWASAYSDAPKGVDHPSAAKAIEDVVPIGPAILRAPPAAEADRLLEQLDAL